MPDRKIKFYKKKRYRLLGFAGVLLLLFAIPEMSRVNKGESISKGSVRNGSLENGYLLPYSGANFSYFSPFSYYILDNAYCHHLVHNTVVDAYKVCKTTCPGVHFGLMEFSSKHGGRVHFHRTHQNGMSADFMIPKLKNGKQNRLLDRTGLSHYLLKFDAEGKNNMLSSITLDFDSMAKHILAVDDAAAKNGLRIRKIILNIDLKEKLYATTAGKEIRKRGIYIVQHLTPIVDKLHDEHYHIDYELL